MFNLFKKKKSKINTKIEASVDYLIYLRDKEVKNRPISIYSSYISLIPMKIQMLLYLSESLSLVKYDKGIFSNNTFHAWRYGPYIPSVYYMNSMYGQNTVPEKEEYEFSLLTEEDKEIILLIWDKFKDTSAYDLVSIAQLGPWEEVYEEYELNNPISQESIKQFFGN